LAQDLLGRAVVVGDGVVGVGVLVEDVGRAWPRGVQALADALGLADVRVEGVEGGLGGRADDGGAEAFEHVALRRRQRGWSVFGLGDGRVGRKNGRSEVKD
jgi:hypothetical protein